MLKYISLGIIQGMTEFLPVSSSGHLAIAQKIFGITEGLVELDIVLHLGTLFAVVFFFFKDILKSARNLKLLALIAVVTLITGVIGIMGKDFFEGLFSSLAAVCAAWIFSGIMLLFTRNFLDGKRQDLNIKDAVILGITQAIAIIPGISRSGITISTLLWRRIDRLTAFSFSFLVFVPVILGAALFKAKNIGFAFRTEAGNLSAGFIFSCLSGFLALWLLKRVLVKAKFHYFGYYCIAMAIVVFLFVK